MILYIYIMPKRSPLTNVITVFVVYRWKRPDISQCEWQTKI